MRPTITIHLPEGLDQGSLARLLSDLDGARTSEASAWILRGASGGRFCRGMAFGELAHDHAEDGLRRFAEVLDSLRRAPRPTVAVVEGEAIGGGLGLAAACDKLIATPAARFALPEALFGILPGVVLPVVLERLTPQRARLLALDGEARDAEWAERAGLVDAVVPTQALDAELRRAVRSLGRVGDARVRGLREWCDQARALPIAEALVRGAAVTGALLADSAVQGALARFTAEGIPPWVEA